MGKLLAGTLLSNLEPVVDQSYIRDEDGTIVGRRAGIKGWLAANCPDMLTHYKALMSYKALADKLRVALAVEEPDTLSGVLDFEKAMQKNVFDEKVCNKDFGENGLNKRETKKETGSGVPEKETGESARESAPKSLLVRNDICFLKSNRESVVGNISSLNDATCGANGAMRHAGKSGSAASLDAALRERLGLPWMQRGRRVRKAA